MSLEERILNNPRFTRPVTHYPGSSGDSDADGYADFDLGTPSEIEVGITSPESKFEVTETTSGNRITHAMCAPQSLAITAGDRIEFSSLGDTDAYMVVEPEPQEFGSDQIAWYKLIEDPRGQESPDDGSGGSSGGSGGDSEYGY